MSTANKQCFDWVGIWHGKLSKRQSGEDGSYDEEVEVVRYADGLQPSVRLQIGID